jgi:hypothetical protein
VRISLVRATDQYDRLLPIRRYTQAAIEGDPLFFGLRLFDDTRTVDLTFAVQKSRFVEFVARPTDANRAAGSPETK